MTNTINGLTNTEILALTIYGEARGEPIEGQIAVGCVIRNRFLAGKYKDYKDVCLQPLQFSCWNPDDVNYAILSDLASQLFTGGSPEPYIRQAMFIADGIVSHVIIDNTNGAKHYLTRSLFDGDKCPKWAKFPVQSSVKIISNQVFFNV